MAAGESTDELRYCYGLRRLDFRPACEPFVLHCLDLKFLKVWKARSRSSNKLTLAYHSA